jgi:hypothetical protein
MILSSELLDRAKAAGARLEGAEREALLARADYHTAIRRLHLAGGSLREVAEALSLSYQRVQQIVSEAGGSWWSRVWRTRRVRPDAICTWCGRPPSEVDKLIAGPLVFICDVCVGSAERAASGRPSGVFAGIKKKKSVAARCAFCGKRASGRRGLGRSGHVAATARACREILDAAKESAGRAVGRRLERPASG